MSKGIDISKWQGSVDFSKVKNEVDFVILREGYGTTIDGQFLNYVKGCKNNNIAIHGVYHFCYSLNESQALNEAKSCIKNIEKAGLGKDTIIFFDFEYDTVARAKKQGVSLGKNQCTSFTVKFCEYVKSQGYTAGVYYNLDYMKTMYDMDKVSDYVQWLAYYNGGDKPYYKCEYHQYTSSGKVSGIAGNVDMNIYYGTKKPVIEPVKPTSKPTSSNNISLSTLRYGSKGATVKTLQILLNYKYVSELSVDGQLGPKTLVRLKAYQAYKKLTIDGICGPKTWESLLNH